jgi:hypothetical protein
MDTDRNTDRDTDTHIDMDMDPAEIYADGSDTPQKFLPGGYDSPQKFVQWVMIPRINLCLEGPETLQKVVPRGRIIRQLARSVFMTPQNHVKKI